jgi:DNA-directed RNA polymerase II subunit RPB2
MTSSNPDTIERAVLETVCRDLLVEGGGVANIQKASFDTFVYHRLQRIIDEEPLLEITNEQEKYSIHFLRVYVDRPYIVDDKRIARYITPYEARLRDLTYSSVVSVDIRLTTSSPPHAQKEKVYRKIPIARLPMMVQSSKCTLSTMTPQERVSHGECTHDDGGYFIIRGKERALVTQERGNVNAVYVFQQKAAIRYPFVAEIRSTSEETGHSLLVQMRLYAPQFKITLALPFFLQDVTVASVLMVLGCRPEDVNSMRESIHSDDYRVALILSSITRDMEILGTRERALRELNALLTQSNMKHMSEMYIIRLCMFDMFPHLGIIEDAQQRLDFLFYMIRRLILTYVGRLTEDDRDHMNNKRYETAGCLLFELFRGLYKRFLRTIEPQLQKRQDLLTILNRTTVITQGLKTCFATGNWGIPKSNYIRCGVSQVLNRLSYNATLSHLRRIIVPIGKEGKNAKIRQVHCSQYGFVCPSETPEGHCAGVVKNFTLYSRVTERIDTTHVCNILRRFFNDLLSPDGPCLVFINGRNMYRCTDMAAFDTRLEICRSRGIIDGRVSCTLDPVLQTCMIYSDEGRIQRPVWNLMDHTYNDIVRLISTATPVPVLLETRAIVYVTSYDVEWVHVAMTSQEITPSTRYLEIHPSLMFSLCIHLIPYVDHIQAPRITYQASMGKQAIGIYVTNERDRWDTVAHVLQYPEKPLVHTHFSHYVKYDALPSGNNIIVAVACYGGYNQEDSVILNQSSVDRGLFRCFTYRVLIIEERKRNNTSHEVIGPSDVHNTMYNYSKLDDHGIARVGSYVGPNDVIVSKTVVTQRKSALHKSDNSAVIRNGEEGYVDQVMRCTTPDGYVMIKVKIRSLRIPEMGDKVASRSAQKGIIGMCLRHEDMPFTSDGIVPDLIINPHCLPSRMTINQLLECVASKAAVLRGDEHVYSTAFSQYSHDCVNDLADQLVQCGYHRHGNETMYNGLTGEMFHTQIFIGPTYYQRLKHLVSSKIHARDHGNVQSLVRQPLEGRRKEGGLRFGEMERDAIISHGVSRFLHERLFDLSDKFSVPLCTQCGYITHSYESCHLCDRREFVCHMNIPYACKLLFQELNALGIQIHFNVTKT